jgi:hypothetical protein
MDDTAIGPQGEPAESAREALREMPTGTNDPNIVGDVGPTDIPPGSDPHDQGELVLQAPDDEAAPEV